MPKKCEPHNVTMKIGSVRKPKIVLRQGARKSVRQKNLKLLKALSTKQMLNALNIASKAPRRSIERNSNNSNHNNNLNNLNNLPEHLKTFRKEQAKRAKNAKAMNALTELFGSSTMMDYKGKTPAYKRKVPKRKTMRTTKTANTEPPSVNKYLKLHYQFKGQRNKGKKKFSNKQKCYLENSYNKCREKYNQLHGSRGVCSMVT